jgi:hypothetical protein
MKNIEKIIKNVLTSNQFKKEFFETINIKTKKHDGWIGQETEKLVFKHLKKYFKNLITDPGKIENKTKASVDFIIDNICFQLKTKNLNCKSKDIRYFNSNFLNKSFKEKMNIYNSKITNTIILIFDRINQKINYCFLTKNDLFIKNKKQIEDKNERFDFVVAKGLTVYYNSYNKQIRLNLNSLILKIKEQNELYLKQLIFEKLAVLIYNQISPKKQNQINNY